MNLFVVSMILTTARAEPTPAPHREVFVASHLETMTIESYNSPRRVASVEVGVTSFFPDAPTTGFTVSWQQQLTPRQHVLAGLYEVTNTWPMLGELRVGGVAQYAGNSGFNIRTGYSFDVLGPMLGFGLAVERTFRTKPVADALFYGAIVPVVATTWPWILSSRVDVHLRYDTDLGGIGIGLVSRVPTGTVDHVLDLVQPSVRVSGRF